MNQEKATFAAGNFRTVEQEFRQVSGVLHVTVGYTGGTAEAAVDPVSRYGATGHAQAVEILYDPMQVTFDDLLEVFWKIHDPTQLDRQGSDVGNQYRSAIFYHNNSQRDAAIRSRAELDQNGPYPVLIVTEVTPASIFYPA